MLKHIESIGRSRLFKGIPKEQIPEVLESLDSQLKNYRSRQLLLESGHKIKRAGLLIEGSLTIYDQDYWGNRTINSVIGPGSIFAENFACSRGSISSITVEAETASVVLWFNMHDFITLSADRPWANILICNLIHDFADKNLEQSRHLSSLHQDTTKQKLLTYLSLEAQRQKSDEFDIPYDRQQLADYLGVERSAMSTQLSRLVKAGYLKTEKNHFLLLKKPEDSVS